jgi:dienelactone hydrolase
MYQNRNTLEVVNATAGSKSMSDFANDALQYAGILNNKLHTKRYKEAEINHLRLQSLGRRMPKVSQTGHSLGGQISNTLVQKGVVDRAVSFNPFIPSKSQNIDDPRIINVRNSRDFASSKTKYNKNTINLENSMNPISSHFMSNIKI